MVSKVKLSELALNTIEQKYGGRFPNLKDYWPPRSFSNATKTLDDENMLLRGIEPFSFNLEQTEEYKAILKLRRAKNIREKKTLKNQRSKKRHVTVQH